VLSNQLVTVSYLSKQRGVGQLLKLEGTFSIKPHALEVA
jgi:hypothetical protein